MCYSKISVGCQLFFIQTILPYWVFVICVCLSTGTHAQSALDQLAQMPASKRVGFIADSLLHFAESTKGLVFDFEIDVSGTQVEFGVKGTPNNEFFPSGTKGTCRFVTSLKQGFATSNINQVYNSTIVTDTESSKTFHIKEKRIVQVDQDCRSAECPERFKYFCRITGASCWLEMSKKICSTDDWVQRFREMEFEEFKTIESLGDVAVVIFKHRDRVMTERWYFGNSENGLVYVGNCLTNESPPSGDARDRIQRIISNEQVGYAKHMGIYLPSRWTVSVMSETLNLENSPVSPPILFRNTICQIKKCKVLPKFPESLLDAIVPSDAKIIDICADRRQRVVEKQVVKSNAYSRWWILAIGLGLCAVAVVTWRKLKK